MLTLINRHELCSNFSWGMACRMDVHVPPACDDIDHLGVREDGLALKGARDTALEPQHHRRVLA